MEERIPPSDKPPLPPPPTSAASSSLETYVVQIPRDQIYRVPPPEHALIIESHKRNSSDQQKTCRRPICWILLPVFLLFAVVFAAVMIARATLYTPVPPEFTVTRVMVRNLAPPPKGGGGSHRQPEFDVTLRAKNPNTRMSVSYLAGGQASLVFKNKKIGKGAAVRSAFRQEPGGGDVDFPVVLAGNMASLTAEIEKSLDGAAEKSMVLQVQAVAEINSWARNERRDLKINCELKVKNSLMNKTKISFQECRTEF